MKHPGGSHLTENGENRANRGGMFSRICENEGGLVPRERYGSLTRKWCLEPCVSCDRPWECRTSLRMS